jgi:sigma-B regulation protein RsbU (phosphoserine phosphatase)
MSQAERDRILVVDDDAGMRRMAERVLSRLYDIETAEGVATALERLEQTHFQVAIVDVQLLDGDGYSLCQQVVARSPETDVILMTGSLSEPDEKLYRSLEEGAFYFLFKPFDRRVLRALVSRCLQLQKERKAKEDYAAELAEDLEKARRFQHSLMPQEAVREAGWLLEGRFQPCDALGGDFYFSLIQRDGSVVFAIADVVGHGVSAAMYCGMLRSVLDAARRRHPDPEDVLPELTSGIDFFEGSRYASLFYGQLLPDGRLRYFNAGHPPPLWHKSDGRVEDLETTGLILTSLFPHDATGVQEIELSSKDRLLAFTDGVYEALDPNGRELERHNLVSYLEQSGKLPVSEALDQLLERVRAHCAGRPFDDDATVLLIERE